MYTDSSYQTASHQEHHHILSCTSGGNEMEARLFYNSLLGLPEVQGEHPDHTLWFQIDELKVPQELEDLLHTEEESKWFKYVKSYLESIGIIVCPCEDDYKHQNFFFLDQFGNKIELMEI